MFRAFICVLLLFCLAFIFHFYVLCFGLLFCGFVFWIQCFVHLLVFRYFFSSVYRLLVICVGCCRVCVSQVVLFRKFRTDGWRRAAATAAAADAEAVGGGGLNISAPVVETIQITRRRSGADFLLEAFAHGVS